MDPTDTRSTEYFHRVVDCQWACPAHTDVPEYIRLVAQGRFADAYVLNRQSAASQMWFAAGARAWHYGWDEAAGAWRDDRDGHALLDRVAQAVSEKLGRPVHP